MCVQSALYICAIVIWVQHQKHYSDCPELLKCYYCCWLSRAVPFLLAIHAAMDTWGSSNGIASSMQIPGSIYVEQHGSFILICPSCSIAFVSFNQYVWNQGSPSPTGHPMSVCWSEFPFPGHPCEDGQRGHCKHSRVGGWKIADGFAEL